MNMGQPRACWRTLRIGVACAVALSTGCATLPDAGKLADASVQLRTAINAGGSAVVLELEAAGDPEHATQFRKAWATSDRSALALAGYAEAVAGIVKAGNEAGESARRLADAGAQLANGVGIALPAAEALEAGVDLGAWIYKQIAVARASKSLEESLANMQPAVDRVADVIGKQLEDAQIVLVSANQIADAKLRDRFSTETGYLIALAKERQALYQVTPLTTANAQRLEQIERVERTVAVKLEPMDTERKASAARLKQASLLITGARIAVADWADAHRQMLVAVREGRTVDPRALLQSVAELRDLVNKLRAAS
jgi:hypothetical protein